MELEKGTYTVLVTPFTKNNYIDFPSLKKIIDNQLNYKTIRGFVILGSTGENSTITDDEKLDIIEFIYKYVNKRKKIILGINNNNTKFCIEMIKKYEEFTDYFMITVPYYNKPSQKGLYTHFKLLSDNTKLPIVLYNIPSRTGINLLPNTIIQLYDTCDNIVAIKESSRNLDQIIKLKRVCNIDIFSGDDELILPILSLGGCGVFSVASSIIPNTISDIVDHCL